LGTQRNGTYSYSNIVLSESAVAAAMEYFMAEIFELSSNLVRDLEKTYIEREHIRKAIDKDMELFDLVTRWTESDAEDEEKPMKKRRTDDGNSQYTDSITIEEKEADFKVEEHLKLSIDDRYYESSYE
jgi:uncharacterized protein YdaU (DUF1376 family)